MIIKNEFLKNLVREYSERVQDLNSEQVKTELLYFLYECEMFVVKNMKR